MAEPGNGHGSQTRLDRIERAIEAWMDGHEQLVASQKQLLTAQVVMTDSVSMLGKSVDELVKKVDAHEDRMQALIDSQWRVDEALASLKKLLDRAPDQR